MIKVRKDFLQSIEIDKAIKYDSLIKKAVITVSYTEGLYFSELNYLTYDELVYLYNNEKDRKNKKYLFEKIKEATIILDKYNMCLQNNTYAELTQAEGNRILILLGLKTVDELFPDFFNKEEMKFNLTKEEIQQKNNLIKNILIKRINFTQTFLFGMDKYIYMYYSIELFSRYMKSNGISSKQIHDEETSIFRKTRSSRSLVKTIISNIDGNLNALLVKYTNEKNKILKFAYYHLILDLSEEQKYINELYLNNELDKLSVEAMVQFYITGGGTPFVLAKDKKIETIHVNVLDELQLMLNKKKNALLKNTDAAQKSNIILFPKNKH